MQKHIPALGLASVLSLALFSSATAGQVTAKDLSGKKICWDNGNISTFSPDGQYSSARVGGGTWALATGGVMLYTMKYNGAFDIDKRPDGTFKSNVEGAVGKYCK